MLKAKGFVDAKKAERKVFFKLQEFGQFVEVALVDEEGHTVYGGHVLGFAKASGKVHLFSKIDPAVAEAAGLELDEGGRVRLSLCGGGV